MAADGGAATADSGGADSMTASDAGARDAPADTPSTDVSVTDTAPGEAGGLMLVFLSSATYDGDFVSDPTTPTAGLLAADQDCQGLARDAGLPGTFKAWLANSDTPAQERLVDVPGGWFLVDATQVASSIAELLSDAGLANSINENERGADVTDDAGNVYAWTGAFTGSNCQGWSTNNGAYQGDVGDPSTTRSSWSLGPMEPCYVQAHLYCFAQP